VTLDSGLLFALIREMRPRIIGARIGDILGAGPLGFVLVLHSKDAPQGSLVASLEPKTSAIYLKENPLRAKGGNPFVSLLKQHLLKARIKDAVQAGFNRIVKLSLVKADELGVTKDYALVLEFLGNRTNAFLLRGEDLKILGQMRPEKTTGRTLGVGKFYATPPDSSPYDLLTVTQEQFLDLLRKKEEDTASILKRNIRGLSPQWAEEILVRAGTSEPAGLFTAIQGLRRRLIGAPEPMLYLEGERPVALSPFPLIQFRNLEAKPFRTLSEACCAMEPRVEGGREGGKGGGNLLEKLKKKLATLEDPSLLRQQAMALERNLRKVPEHALEFAAEGKTILLDPKKTPEENLQALYKRYRKAKQGRETLKAKIANLEAGVIPTSNLKHQKSKIPPPPGWEPIFLPNGEKIAPRRFTSPNGFLALVGRTNTENDLLTLKFAGPRDIFLHTRGNPGSHTILRVGSRKEKPPKEDILFAARIAAYFSKARQAKHVSVSYTECQWVHKPKGAKPGLVVITQEKTVFVEPSLPQG